MAAVAIVVFVSCTSFFLSYDSIVKNARMINKVLVPMCVWSEIACWVRCNNKRNEEGRWGEGCDLDFCPHCRLTSRFLLPTNEFHLDFKFSNKPLPQQRPVDPVDACDAWWYGRVRYRKSSWAATGEPSRRVYWRMLAFIWKWSNSRNFCIAPKPLQTELHHVLQSTRWKW